MITIMGKRFNMKSFLIETIIASILAFGTWAYFIINGYIPF